MNAQETKVTRNTIKGHGLAIGAVFAYAGCDTYSTDSADMVKLTKEGVTYVLTVTEGRFAGQVIARVGAAKRIWVRTQPTQVDTLTAQTELYERAMCLGYSSDSAARLADCFTNWDNVSDPCAKHPGHSTAMRDGYAVDGCEACEVIVLSDVQGYFAGMWASILADRETEYVKIMEGQISQAYAASECACDLIIEMGTGRLPIGGRVCLVCGSVFTVEGGQASETVLAESDRIAAAKLAPSIPTDARTVTTCGTFALGETVTHAEMGTGVIVYVGSAGGIEIEFAGGSTIGVDEDHYAEWSQVRTDAPVAPPTAVYIRPDGTRQQVTMADMAEVGMRVAYGYGAVNNGTVVKVSAHAATVKRQADGSQYLLTLVELVRDLNRANVSTFMPDANGRPIGSWR